jgi:acyl-CoA synthetase (AMP-forming)/AMP-acid ligase II
MQINILEFFEQGALKHFRDKVGFSDFQDSFTFGEIEHHAKNIAMEILSRKDALNRPVAVFLPKCAKELVADLGILYSGNFYVNLDEQAPSVRTRHILDNIDPMFIITQHNQAATLTALGFPAGRLLFVEELFMSTLEKDNKWLMGRIDLLIDTDPVCMINTSGSTGIPKSVMLCHRGLIDFINWWDRRFLFDENEVVGSLSPFFLMDISWDS